MSLRQTRLTTAVDIKNRFDLLKNQVVHIVMANRAVFAATPLSLTDGGIMVRNMRGKSTELRLEEITEIYFDVQSC